MSERLYSVLIESEAAYGRDAEAVREELSDLGLLRTQDIERLLAGKPVVLQTGLSHEQALRYQDALEAAGARSRLVASREEAPSSADRAPGPDTEAPPQLTWGGLSASDFSLAPAPKELETWMTCPKCGVHQVEAAECSGCGVIVSKFTQRAKTGQEAPWEKRDLAPPIDEDDMYQGPARAGSARRTTSPKVVALRDLTGSDVLAILTGVLASVGRMLVTAAKITGSALYRQSRRGLAWLNDQIRTRLAERRTTRASRQQQSSAPDKPGA